MGTNYNANDVQHTGKAFSGQRSVCADRYGKAIYRLLFDCGENCLTDISDSEIQGVEHLFFSHFHMDHASGFDRFFRRNYNREAKPVHVWGPVNSADIMHHRFRGYVWNLIEDQPGVWLVTDVNDDSLKTWRFETKEAFSLRHALEKAPFSGTLFENADFGVEAQIMDHGTPCLAYAVYEKAHVNVDPVALSDLGLAPGPWLKTFKENHEVSNQTVSVMGRSFSIGELRDRLLRVTKGKKIAYLTDFKMDEKAEMKLSGMLTDCDILICESQYMDEDRGNRRAVPPHDGCSSGSVCRKSKRGETHPLSSFEPLCKWAATQDS